MTSSYLDRLAARSTAVGTVLCVGLDPDVTSLPPGFTPDLAGLERFTMLLIEATVASAAAFKANLAFYESHGSAGLAVLERIRARIPSDVPFIADAKRGDIDSTAAAYADAWLSDASPLAADAVTAHAYLGLAALLPLVRLAATTGRGVLVVARSSNPEGRSLQQAITSGGPAVEDMILGEIAALNGSPDVPTGTVGAVVGATLEPSVFPLSQLGGVILAPGLGAQGAGPDEVARRFAGCRPGTVLPSSSRALLSAGPDPAALRRRAASAVRELAAAMG